RNTAIRGWRISDRGRGPARLPWPAGECRRSWRRARTRREQEPPKDACSLAGLRARGQWKQRRKILRLLLLFNLDLIYQQRRRDSGNRHASRFGAAVAVEDLRPIGSRQDLVKAGQRRSHNVGAADQFVGAPVRVDAM